MTASRKKELLDTMLRAEIVDIVLSIIRNEETITMDEVAKRSGVAKGTLYNYFDNKESLMDHVHKAVLEPIHEKTFALFNNDSDPFRKILDFIDAILEFNDDVHIYFQFLQEIRTVAEENKERNELAVGPLAKVCKEGIENGQFIDVDPYILAETLFGLIVGPLKSMQFREENNPNMNKIKQDIIYVVNRILIK